MKKFDITNYTRPVHFCYIPHFSPMLKTLEEEEVYKMVEGKIKAEE